MLKFPTRFLPGSLWGSCWPVAITLSFFSLGSSVLYAQTDWRGTPSVAENWFDSTFWTNGVPNNSVDATVNNGGIAQIAQPTITPPPPPQVATAATLTIGTSTTTGSTVELFTGNPTAPGLTVNNLIVGQNGTFAFDGGFATWGSFQNSGTVDFAMLRH